MSKSKILSAAPAASAAAAAAAPLPVTPPPADDAEESPALTMERLMEVLRSATEDERLAVRELLGVSAAPAKKVAVAAGAKKSAIPAARKAAAAAPLPEPDEDGAPSAESYRLKEEDIDHAVCVGRILKGGKDRRWAPAIYREFQCAKATEEECDLCKVCQARLEKYAEEPKAGGDWNGRVTEEPHAGVHMLGTEWAEARKPKWLGEGAAAAASDSGSEASSAAASSAAASSKAAEKEAAKAAKAEEKAAKAAEKEAAKASKEAEKAAKAAEKEAAKAAKEAEKAAKAAEKEAAKKAKEEEKAAKAAAKTSAKPAAKKAAAPAVKKAAGGAGAPAPAAAPAKAASAEAAAEVEMELKLIDGTIYAVKGKNVYKYDEDSEEAGVYEGRLTDDETIDREAAEEEAEGEEE
jgi:flagellar biosynthesis GTPase FlhF